MPIVAIIIALAAAQPAPMAQQMMCTEPLPLAMASWTDPLLVKSGAAVPVGHAARVNMTTDATFAVAPEKAPTAGTYGGTLSFQIKTAGVYRVSLGGPVWIDVVKAGKAVKSGAHGHGGECSPVKKKVDFTLSPGAYTLQLSGSKTPVVGVFVGPAT